MRSRNIVVGLLLAGAVATQLPGSGSAIAAEPTAAELTDQAYERYQAGDYPTAVSLYMKAYNLSVDARILFNVAQIYDKKVQDRELALEYYRRYLKSTTAEPELVKKATERVTELQRQQEELSKPAPTASAAVTATASAAATTTSTATPTATPTVRTESRPVWIGYGTAGVLAVGAAITGALALSGSGEVSRGAYAGSTPPADLRATADRTGTLAVTTDVLIGGAAVAAVVTLIVHIASPKSGSEVKSALRPAPAGAGVMWRF